MRTSSGFVVTGLCGNSRTYSLHHPTPSFGRQLYALLMKMSTPEVTGGMEPTVALICYFAFTIVFGALIVVCWNFSRQLARESKGQHQTP